MTDLALVCLTALLCYLAGAVPFTRTRRSVSLKSASPVSVSTPGFASVPGRTWLCGNAMKPVKLLAVPVPASHPPFARRTPAADPDSVPLTYKVPPSAVVDALYGLVG